ncbi:hypothetical protein, partial [Halococcus sp. PRR34]|uniref:hypothetical protein n=1 Tax=Halococcus sp. PRR34 TaxID=3020830 RepID=UPI00235EECFD
MISDRYRSKDISRTKEMSGRSGHLPVVLRELDVNEDTYPNSYSNSRNLFGQQDSHRCLVESLLDRRSSIERLIRSVVIVVVP